MSTSTHTLVCTIVPFAASRLNCAALGDREGRAAFARPWNYPTWSLAPDPHTHRTGGFFRRCFRPRRRPLVCFHYAICVGRSALQPDRVEIVVHGRRSCRVFPGQFTHCPWIQQEGDLFSATEGSAAASKKLVSSTGIARFRWQKPAGFAALFLLFFLVSARALHAEPAHSRPAVTKSPAGVSATCQLCDTPDCALLTCSTPLYPPHTRAREFCSTTNRAAAAERSHGEESSLSHPREAGHLQPRGTGVVRRPTHGRFSSCPEPRLCGGACEVFFWTLPSRRPWT
jgi:hypothetical protein